MARFFGKEIEVRTEGEVRRPVSFRIDDTWYDVDEVLLEWPDYGFGKGPLKKYRWWQRHHRNYYRVRTGDNQVFEIYFDRGTSLKNPKYRKWYVTRQFDLPL